jgi:CubicO group peptidase (beta-lactamase class C family)
VKTSRRAGIAGIGALAAAVALVVLAQRAVPLLDVALAYKAKVLCSGVLVSRRPAESVLAEDLAVEDLAPLRFLPAAVDPERGTATAGLPGILQRTAVYRPGLGCSLVPPGGPPLAKPLRAEPFGPPVPETAAASDARLEAALDWAYAEPDPARPRRTRAVVVVRDGRVLAERYAEGFGAETPLAGWSLAKLATNALAGILAGQGRLDLAARADVPEWRSPGDPRAAITVGQLLRMESGLEFSEEPGEPLQDVTFMLFRAPDAAAYAAGRPLRAEPGSRWSYASGNSNILHRLMRGIVGESGYPDFPRQALFEPLGMRTAVLETDSAGTFVGSSFLYASARDWARLGSLYADDGVHGGVRLLPPGWVRDSARPARSAPRGEYGAHLWLKPFDEPAAPLPPDAFHGVGFEGQYLSVVPSRRLVVVRLGLTRTPGAWRQDEFLRRVLAALGD